MNTVVNLMAADKGFLHDELRIMTDPMALPEEKRQATTTLQGALDTAAQASDPVKHLEHMHSWQKIFSNSSTKAVINEAHAVLQEIEARIDSVQHHETSPRPVHNAAAQQRDTAGLPSH